jgi:hypothetical protein
MTDPTSWVRLEPSPRDPTLADGLAAVTADPLWLLARQLAFGEFTGYDGGSPTAVQLQASASALTRIRPGGTASDAILLPLGEGPGGRPQYPLPLETLIEAEWEPGPRPLTADPGMPAYHARPIAAAQAGLHYFRLLDAAPGIGDITAYRTGLAARYPIPAAPSPTGAPGPPAATATDPYIRQYAGRVPDGQALYHDLLSVRGTPPTLPPQPARTGADDTVITAVALQWLAWYEATSGAPLGSAISELTTWQPQRLEYAASIAAPGPDSETVLATAEHTSGPIDWYDFDIAASARHTAAAGITLGATPADLSPPPSPITIVTLPTPATYPGMPSSRWWALEDAAVNFGDITAPVESPITALVVEYVLRYGNDHYVVPIRLALGSVIRTNRLIVTNTFGEQLLVRPITDLEPDGPFRLFEHTMPPPASAADQPRDPLLALLPTLDQPLSGPPLEKIDYLRDELADIVWAVEHTALGSNGAPTDRSAESLAAGRGPGTSLTPAGLPPANGIPTLQYLLRSDVEENWFAFTLANPEDATNPTVMPFTEIPPISAPGTATPATPVPWTAILIEQSTGLPQEEITRAGLQATRQWRYARWLDGTQLCWVARHIEPGQGEGSSGLTFDAAL